LENSNLTKIKIKSVYRSSDDDMLNDFYLPALSNSVKYYRAVGFFSTALLEYALKGLSKFSGDKGSIRILVGFPLAPDEYEALVEGNRIKDLHKKITLDFSEFLQAEYNPIQEKRLRLLVMLVGSGVLNLKFACRKAGMYHEKIGVMEDFSGNKIVFQGSANETVNAINQDLNFESITVFRSWQQEYYEEYGKPFESGFHRLWNGDEKNVLTIDMPDELYEKVCKDFYQKYKVEENSSMYNVDESTLQKITEEELKKNLPEIPSSLGGRPFKILNHQEQALRNWFENKRIGLLKLATGAGKTITAMYGFTKIFKNASKPRRMMVVVSVPYQALAEQWVKELSLFNVKPIKCFYGRQTWDEELNQNISLLLSGSLEFLCIVVVNKTLLTDYFINCIERVPSANIFFIGDECHRHASFRTVSKLPDAVFKMGLSATPFISGFEDNDIQSEEEKSLCSYYGKIVAEYSLADALADNVLTQYEYNIITVCLTIEESEKYDDLTKDIGRQMAIDSSECNSKLSSLIRQRNNIVANANNKVKALIDYLDSNPIENKTHTLFYVGEGKALDSEAVESDDCDNLFSYDYVEGISQLENISISLKSRGWKLSKFTSQESPNERKAIMRNFVDGDVDGLVSMKVLDEGIDIPLCKRAFILASSRNTRQFIQRRGRILRRSAGKDFAEIFDFIVVPSKTISFSAAGRSLVKKELSRAMEFIRLSKNRKLCEAQANEIAEFYNLNLDEV
jgi:superfamily II DNA or RNA helicase